jgi:hypothetical protein
MLLAHDVPASSSLDNSENTARRHESCKLPTLENGAAYEIAEDCGLRQMQHRIRPVQLRKRLGQAVSDGKSQKTIDRFRPSAAERSQISAESCSALGTYR